MNLDLSPEIEAVRQRVRTFAESDVAPGAAARDRDSIFPHDLVPKLATLKLTGLAIPEALGGAGLSALAAAVVIEELARVDGALALTVASHNALCLRHVYRFGSDAQRERFVPRLARGEVLGAWALTEPQAGSDTHALETTAKLDGQRWILNGAKMFVTQGSVAGLYVVFAVTDASGPKKRLSTFIVERGTPGLTASAPADKFGVRASDTADLTLTDVRLPPENLIGALHAGTAEATEILQSGRIGIGALAVGLAQAAFEAGLAYARARVAFGRPIAEHGAIQSMLADMATEIDAARLIVYHAAARMDRGEPFGVEAAMAKLYASEAATRAANKALQIHGGRGFRKSVPVERYLRDAKLCEIGEGTSEVQRLIIARALLRAGAEPARA